MSNFQIATVRDAFDLGAGTSIDHTVKLPNAHPISRIYLKQEATHGAAVQITQTRIEVLVDGSPVLAISGEDLRKITKFDSGRDFAAAASAATSTQEQVIHFGRFARDALFALPAPLFSNVELRLVSTLSATPVTSTLSVAVEEILGVKAEGMVIRKRTLVDDEAAAANKQHDTDLPRGNGLGAVYVDYADVDNVDGATLRLGVNNFTRRLVEATRTAIEALNRQQFNFDDDAIPTTMIALPLDGFGDPANALPTDRASDVKLRWKSAGSGTSGNVRVIAEEYIPVS